MTRSASKTKTSKTKSVLKSVHRFGPITIAVITVIYLIYRVAIVVYPSLVAANYYGVFGDSYSICNQDEDTQNLPALLSESYKNRIAALQPKSSNLVENPDITEINHASGQPIGYTHSIAASEYTYQTVQNLTTKQYFLRLINSQTKNDNNGPYPAWLMMPIKVESDNTYAYSFQYRSNTKADVTIEYTKNNQQKSEYMGVTTVEATSGWKSFSAHFNAFDGITSFRVIINGVGAGQLDLGAFDIHQVDSSKLKNGAISIVFEDGWQSIADGAVPILDKYSIQTTQYIISEAAAGGMAGYMSFDTVHSLKVAGHEIGSHSLSHCNQSELSNQETIDDASNSKQTLEKMNLGPITSFAYPLGKYNWLTQNIYPRHYKYVLTSDSGYNDKYFDETRIKSMGVLETTSGDEFKSWLDQAKKNGQWLVVSYHHINESGEYNITSSEFDNQMKMVVESGLSILPVSKAADFIRN